MGTVRVAGVGGGKAVVRLAAMVLSPSKALPMKAQTKRMVLTWRMLRCLISGMDTYLVITTFCRLHGFFPTLRRPSRPLKKQPQGAGRSGRAGRRIVPGGSSRGRQTLIPTKSPAGLFSYASGHPVLRN